MARNLGGRTDAWELAGVLRAADVLVSGNTGPAHLAAAVGTPVVSLFSPVVRPTAGGRTEYPACCSAISRRPARTAEPGTARSWGTRV